MSKKRTPIEIIDAIYDALPVGAFQTVEVISHKAGVDQRTTQKWLDIMEHILKMQRRENWLITAKLGENRGYAKKFRSER